MRWFVLLAAAAAGLGCPAGTEDLCAAVTCAPGRFCVAGRCVPRSDLWPDAPVSTDGPLEAAPGVDVAADLAVDHAAPDASPCSPGTKEVTVKAYVEGLSYIRIQDNKAWWYHVTYTAPGLSVTPPHQTYLNGVAWTPTWPFSSGTGWYCKCESSKYDLCGAGVALGPTPKFSAFKKISGPGVVALVQAPTAGNGYRTMVEIHDTPYGAAWYEFSVTFK